MIFYLGSDHAGFLGKRLVKNYLLGLEKEVVDLGTDSEDRVDYPDFAKKVALVISKSPQAIGILTCGSGIGVSMVANRFQNVRAALCRNPQDAQLARSHNDANILCMGERTTTPEDMISIVEQWLKTPFEEGRHRERVDKFNPWGEPVR